MSRVKIDGGLARHALRVKIEGGSQGMCLGQRLKAARKACAECEDRFERDKSRKTAGCGF